jgi:antitoxin MazE
MRITQTLGKWGNGTGLRLPKKVLERANIQPDQELEVTIEGRSIVLTPVDAPERITIDEMLEGATREIVGGEFGWGADIGREQIDW